MLDGDKPSNAPAQIKIPHLLDEKRELHSILQPKYLLLLIFSCKHHVHFQLPYLRLPHVDYQRVCGLALAYF